ARILPNRLLPAVRRESPCEEMKTRAGGWRCLSLESGWAGESLCLCPLKHSCKAKGQRLPGCLTSKAAQQTETLCFTKEQGKEKRKSRSIALVLWEQLPACKQLLLPNSQEWSAKENPCSCSL